VQLLEATLTALAAIIGVVVGGVISSRSQRSGIDASARIAARRDKQEACVQYLAAVRRYRRYVMYTDVSMAIVDATTESKGTVIFAGGSDLQAALSDAYARLLILVDSERVHEAARTMASLNNRFVRLRAQVGKGMVPNEILNACRSAETTFADISRSELQIGVQR
jgi:hypothetical protein